MPHKEDIRKWCLMFYLEMQGPSVFLELATLLHPFLLQMQHGNLSLCKLGPIAKTYSILTFLGLKLTSNCALSLGRCT